MYVCVFDNEWMLFGRYVDPMKMVIMSSVEVYGEKMHPETQRTSPPFQHLWGSFLSARFTWRAKTWLWRSPKKSTMPRAFTMSNSWCCRPARTRTACCWTPNELIPAGWQVGRLHSSLPQHCLFRSSHLITVEGISPKDQTPWHGGTFVMQCRQMERVLFMPRQAH